MILDDTIDNHLDITPIPIKIMQNDYYTNWLPIQQINLPDKNNVKVGKVRSKLKEKKEGKVGRSKKERANRKMGYYDEEYSYFKMWSEKKGEHEKKESGGKDKEIDEKEKGKKKGEQNVRYKCEQNQINLKTVQLDLAQKRKKKLSDQRKLPSQKDTPKGRKKTTKKDEKNVEKEQKDVEEEKSIDEESDDKAKISEIMFDYYGIGSTQGSDHQEPEQKEEKKKNGEK